MMDPYGGMGYGGYGVSKFRTSLDILTSTQRRRTLPLQTLLTISLILIGTLPNKLTATLTLNQY